MTKFDETETSDDGTDNGQIYPADGIHPRTHAAVGPFLFQVDPAIPEDEIHLRNSDGKTIGKIVNVGEPPMNPTLKAAHDLFCKEPDPGRPRKGENFWDWAERRRWELFVEGERLKNQPRIKL